MTHLNENLFSKLLNNKKVEEKLSTEYGIRDYTLEDIWRVSDVIASSLPIVLNYSYQEEKALSFYVLAEFITISLFAPFETLQEIMGDDFNSLKEEEKEEIKLYFENHYIGKCNLHIPSDCAKFLYKVGAAIEDKYLDKGDSMSDFEIEMSNLANRITLDALNNEELIYDAYKVAEEYEIKQ